MLKWLGTGLAVCVLASGVAVAEDAKGAKEPKEKKAGKFAQKGAAKGLPSFETLDKDGDGKISKDEVPDQGRQIFTFMDADKDGSLSKTEYDDARKRMAGLAAGGRPKEKPGVGKPELEKKPAGDNRPAKPDGGFSFETLDKNGDGKIAKDEAPAQLTRYFEKIDRNGDGALSREEMEEVRKRMAANPGPQGKPQLDPEQILRLADKNRDGKIQKDEAPGPMRERFDAIDSNRDGALDKEELQKAMEIMRRRMAEGARPGGGKNVQQQFNDLDVDADGRLTKAEVKGVFAEHFAKLDKNNDGKLDVLEAENGLREKEKQDEKK